MDAAVGRNTRGEGLALAVEIQRRHPAKDWRRQVDAIEDPELRAVAEDYLGGMVTRMNFLRSLRMQGRGG